MPRARTATTDFALLGALAQGGPMSGYDLRAYLEASVAQFWSESFRQIYPALARLTRRKFATRRTDAGSPRARKVFEITAAGRAALSAWLALPPEPERPRSELLLKTFLGDQAPPGAVAAHLAAYAERCEAAVRRLVETERSVRRTDAGAASLPFSLAAIRAGVRIQTARAAWAREALQLCGGAAPPPSEPPR